MAESLSNDTVGGAWRQHPEVWWEMNTHHAPGMHSVSHENPRGKLKATLVVPDVEARRGWREWYVYEDVPGKETHRLGLRPSR